MNFDSIPPVFHTCPKMSNLFTLTTPAVRQISLERRQNPAKKETRVWRRETARQLERN